MGGDCDADQPLSKEGKRHHLLPDSLTVSAVMRRKDFVVSTLSTLMGYMSSETLKSPSRSQTERQGGRAIGKQPGADRQGLNLRFSICPLQPSPSMPQLHEEGILILRLQVCKDEGSAPCE